MSHDIIIILSEIDLLIGQNPDTTSFLHGLRNQVEAVQAAWRASEDAGDENHAAHHWLEDVQAAIASASTTLQNLSANCPIK